MTKLGLDQGGEEGIGGCATEEEAQSNIRQLREQLENLLAEETQLKETLQALDAEKAEARSGNLNQTFPLSLFADENIIDLSLYKTLVCVECVSVCCDKLCM